ncbi:hypothetical protein FCULG_00002012 [Fusarium culmorum]|uniref:Uncharacterized protein n=1 Tax=Fusarium culmorum TaxID=5516 RepID=A0A2T4GPJ7_FUSCU|nr:hypothetical protein FCULG_00002012 [Fusarium culmorum]
MLGRSFLLVAMAALSSASYIVRPRPDPDTYRYLHNEEGPLPKPELDSSRIVRALTVPYVPVQDPTPVIVPDPTWNKEYTFSWYRPRQTAAPEWSTRLRQPAASTTTTDEPALPLKMTEESVSIPTTVIITKPTGPPVWQTLPDPDESVPIPWTTTSTTLSEPTLTSLTVPESTAVLEPTASLHPTATLEPTETSVPKGKSSDAAGPIIAGIIGAMVFTLQEKPSQQEANYRPSIQEKSTSGPCTSSPCASGPSGSNSCASSDAPSKPVIFSSRYPSDRQSTFTREWTGALRAWMRVPGRSRQDDSTSVVSRPANVYTGRPVGIPPPAVNANTRPGGNPDFPPMTALRPQHISDWSPRSPVARKPVPSVGTTPRPAASSYLALSPYTTQSGRNWRPSQYSESVYSQPGPGVRPDSGRPLGGNWL